MKNETTTLTNGGGDFVLTGRIKGKLSHNSDTEKDRL